MALRIKLFGSLLIQDETGVTSDLIKWSKACALLAYLVVTGEAQSREFLADLLWEATSTAQSLQNLRKLLSRMRKWVPELEATRQQVAYNPDAALSIDYLTVTTALTSGGTPEIDEALRLYDGELLKGFYLKDTPRFNEWLLLEREELRQRVTAAYRQVCFTYAEQEAWQKGIDAAQRWYSLDPFDEEALRHLMQMLARDGQVEFALQKYALSRQQLWDELGVEPEQSTLAIAQELTNMKEEADERFFRNLHPGAQMEWSDPEYLAEPEPLPPLSILPFQRNLDFTGRQDSLLYLAKMLLPWPGAGGSPTRAAAITGMGGLGKTQLAVEFCYRYGRYFPGGVFWFNFADPQNVAIEVAACGGERGIGLYREAESLTLIDQIGQVKRAWQETIPRLLIFDNCEDEALLAQWLPVTGGCRVLLTSRRADWARELRIAEWPLSVLDSSESVSFLRQIATRLDPGEASEIAAELGHLPLALHLAGGFLHRYRQVSVQSYLSQLRVRWLIQHSSLNGRGISHSPTGHELNVFHTFANSFDLLDPENEIDEFARNLLVRAACFAPSTPISRGLLLKTIVSDEGNLEAMLQAEDGLERLVSLGFLKREGPETVVIHRLVAAYAKVVSASNEDAVAAVRNMMVQVLSTRLYQQGHLGQLPIAANHLRHVTNMAFSAKAPVALRLGTLFGHHLRDIADYDGAQEVLKQVLSISSLTEDTEEVVRAWIEVARVQRSIGNDQEALNSAEQAEHLLRSAEDFSLELLAHVLHRKGWSLFMLGRADETIAVAEEALSLSKKANSDRGLIENLNLLAEVHSYLLEQYEIAVRYIDEALEITRKMRSVRAEAVLLSNLGEIVERQGDFKKACHLYQKAINLSIETGNKDKEITFRTNMGRAQVLLGAYDAAVDSLEELISLLPQNSYLFSEIQLSLAGAYLGQGRLDLALAAGQQALTHAGSQNQFIIGQTWATLGRIAAQLKAPVHAGPIGDVSYDAPACFRRSLEFFSKLRSQWGRAFVLRYWAGVEMLQGNKELGKKMWHEARDIFVHLNMPLMAARMGTVARAMKPAYKDTSETVSLAGM